MAIEKLKRHKSPGVDQIPAELVKAGCRTTGSEIHKLTHSKWNKDELPEEWKSRSLYQFTRRVIKQVVLIIEVYHFCQLQHSIEHHAIKVNSICRGNYVLEILSEDLNVKVQLMII
jgi:aromatic ring-opening dioxygenase catalytic subunit (LigB family)